MRRGRRWLASVAGAMGLWACDAAPASGPQPPWPIEAWPALVEPADNPTTPDKVALGRLLFYDPVLGSDGETACATCHSEIWGMGDGLARSVGIGGGTLTGPGREGPNVGRRNAQTLWNVGYRRRLFWDGREASLEAQALTPLASPVELDKAPEAVVAELASIEAYVVAFEAAFPDDPEPVSVDNLGRALAAFQRTLVSDHALYDSWLAGDAGALSEEMLEGMAVFGAAGCVDCHVPPTFDSEVYADRGIGGGEGASDLGRFEVSGADADRGRFLTPTLRNVRDSEPYFHDGSVETLEEAVAHELALSPEGPFGPDEERALNTFVKKALVDRSREPDRPEAVPSGLPVPEDGFRIPR